MLRWAILAVILLAACGGTAKAAAPTTHTITGTMNLHDDRGNFFPNLPTCTGIDGFDDIGGGTQVTVTNEKGTVVGVGQLGPGKFVDSDHCMFSFSVDKVPNAAFYTVAAAHRGGATYSAEQMATGGWIVNLTLG